MSPDKSSNKLFSVSTIIEEISQKVENEATEISENIVENLKHWSRRSTL